ncbi:dihydrodipicolinate synthase family protein [Angustibacter speluncae]
MTTPATDGSAARRFAGVLTPICTPLTDDGEVDVDSLGSLVEFQLAAGASGVFVLGSSGEAIYLDDGARRTVAVATREALDGRGHLVVGALAPTADRVVQQLELLADVGADAFVVTPPFYAVPSPREVVAHFRQVAAAAGSMPLFAYDIPGNVGYKLDPALAVQLLGEGTVVALKDSSGDLDAFARVAAGLGPDRRCGLLSGADTTAVQALDRGADGLIAGLANVRPDLFVRLMDAHRTGAQRETASLQGTITALNDLFAVGRRHGLGRHASEIGGLKHILRGLGVIASARTARPLEPYPPAAAAEADALWAELPTAQRPVRPTSAT